MKKHAVEGVNRGRRKKASMVRRRSGAEALTLYQGLARCRHERRAVLAVNVFGYDSFGSLATTFAASGTPVIGQFSARFFKHTSPATVVRWREEFRRPGIWLHLDHCEEEALVLECARAGFDSVMYDGSAGPLAENVAKSAAIVRAVKQAAPDSLVECEIGHVAGVEDGFGHDHASGRVPLLEEVLAFQAEVRPDMLAVGFGNMHGHYKGNERFDLALMRKVGKALPMVPMVLHGGSGMALPIVQTLVNHGHCKINISTDLKVAWMDAARRILGRSGSPLDAMADLRGFQDQFFTDLHGKYASVLFTT